MPNWKKLITSGSAASLSSLTLDTALPVSEGGTGATSLTSNGILTGNGTSAIQAESNLTFDGTHLSIAATGRIYLDGGSDTYIHEASAGIYELRVNNLDVMSADMNAGANVVFNDQQLDIDFRIESNNASHTFFVDAGEDRVGIGTNSPDSFVHISASVGSSTASLHVEGSGSEVFAVDGTNGRLFTVTDELSGSLFSANTIAGLPVIEAFSDYKVTLGPYSSQTTVDSSGNLSVSGEIRATGDVIAYYSSDERFKDNIQPIQDSLYKISKIGGYEYDWNDKQSTYEGHDVGVIAQEIHKVLPEVVTERNDGYLAVKYEKIVPLLIESIKELKQEVDDIKKNCKCLSDGNEL